MDRKLRLVAAISGIALLATALLSAPASAATSKVRLAPVLDGYRQPVLVASHPGAGRKIFIVEQGGKIKRASFREGRYRKLGVYLDISDRSSDPTVDGNGSQGLLGMAFHPDYRKNGRFYVFYTRDASGGSDSAAVVSEFRRKTSAKARLASERILMVIEGNGGHNGGHLAFGPDKRLYISLGDAGGSGDPKDNGQDLSTLWGSLLRIDPADPDGGGPRRYRVPSANPYVGKGGRNEIWAHGLRNPWRYSFDRANGNLWLSDVGEGRREEINKATSNRFGKGAGKGKNYGWADCEGSLEFKDDEGDADNACDSHVRPRYDYAVERGGSRCSVTGGYVHRGPGDPKWRGLYVAGDFCGRVFVLNQSGKLKWSKDASVSLTSFGEDADGRLFATGYSNGKVYRVRMVGPRP